MFRHSVYLVSSGMQSLIQSRNCQEEPVKNTSVMASSKEKNSGGTLLPWTAEFGSISFTLKEFSLKNEIPNFVKITKGHYMNIGQSRFSLQKAHQQLYLHSVRSCVKVLSHSIQRLGDSFTSGLHKQRISNKKIQSLEQRLAIPITYQGWFEVLSEDGRRSRPIESVQDLAKIFPEKCLVRQNIVAYGANDDGRLSSDVKKAIQVGEQLLLSGDITTSFPPRNTKVKLLRCMNSKGENIYLPFEQRGVFSPISSGDNVTGVLRISDIVQKFCMPLTVRLVHGIWPRVDNNRFSGFIRLDWVYIDETAFVCPFEKDQLRMIPIPLDAPICVTPATNFKSLTDRDTYNKIQLRCTRMVANYNNTIHLIVAVPNAVAKSHKMSRNMFSAPRKQETKTKQISKKKEEKLMNEIDDIYQYVREGGVPPKTQFSYDSDEESYWEEPAYEPIDHFQQRLKAIQAGKRVQYPQKYQPADTAKLDFGTDLQPTNNNNSISTANKLSDGSLETTVLDLICEKDTKDEKQPQEPQGPQQQSKQKKDDSEKNLDLINNNSGSSKISSDSKEEVEIFGITRRSSTSDPPPPVPPRRYKRSGSVPILDSSKTQLISLAHAKSDRILMHSASGKSNGDIHMKSSKTKGLEDSSYFKELNKKRQTMYL